MSEKETRTLEEAGEYAGKKKTRIGRVVSDKMDKTVVVLIERTMRHPIYHKTVRRSTKYQAHSENNDCHVGDLVEIVETRPISRHKKWRVRAVIEKAK